MVDPAPRRVDGGRFVRGDVRFTDDELPSDCLHLVFVRSGYAHARLESVDVAPALALPGVRAALTGADSQRAIADLLCTPPAVLTGAGGPLALPCLPTEHIRYWGEPVALVVADSEDLARHAAALVQVRCTPLTPLLDIAAATAEGARLQHPQLAGNTVMASALVQGDSAAAIEGAPGVVEGEVRLGRSSAVPLELRTCIARWDDQQHRLLVRVASQMPHAVRADLARQLGLPEPDVHVLTPPLGGAFGFKFPGLPEEPLTCLMALRLKRPVRWAETRAESLLVGAREYRASYQAGFDASGKVLGLRVDLDADIGALCASPGPLMPLVAAATFPGAYDIADLTVNWRVVTTNKGPWNGARGFGKEATCVVLESAMDDVARVLGLDPVDVRRRNLLHADQLPHRTASMTLDSGDYHRALDMVLELGDYRRLRARQSAVPVSSHTRLGVAVAFELTPEGMDPAGTPNRGQETATVRLDTSGYATVLTGVTSPGTGSDTAIAQIVAERLGVALDRVRVVQGDTDRTPYGAGSFSSRAVLVAGTAAWLAAGDLRSRLVAAASVLLGAAAEQVEVSAGAYRVVGEPQRMLPVTALIQAMRSLGGAVPGIADPGLEATRSYVPGNIQALPDSTGRVQQYPTYPYSVHLACVEVDLQTGVVTLDSLAAVDDCGTTINADLVAAQLHGAVAMGVGMALFEEEAYGAHGEPLARDFKTYLLPRVKELPHIRVGHLESPSPFTAMGTKGAGETGVGGAAAAVLGAVRDAVGAVSGFPVQTPMTPARVLDRVHAQAHKPVNV